jgi:hypothetical protein
MFSLNLIDVSPDCLCHPRARMMDILGCRWCLENQETIVDWLEEEAIKRDVAFDRDLASRLVLIAIHRGRSGVKLRFSRRRSGSDKQSGGLLRGRVRSFLMYLPSAAFGFLFARSSILGRVKRAWDGRRGDAGDHRGELPELPMQAVFHARSCPPRNPHSSGPK